MQKQACNFPNEFIQKFVYSAGTQFVCGVGLHGCILPEIRGTSAEGYRLHFRYHLH